MNISRRNAIIECRAEADSVIDQLTRTANGWDTGTHSAHMRLVDRNSENTIEKQIERSVSHAFACAKAAFAP